MQKPFDEALAELMKEYATTPFDEKIVAIGNTIRRLQEERAERDQEPEPPAHYHGDVDGDGALA